MHLLQQHIVDVQCNSLPFGKEVQNALSDVLEKDFYPKLEIILDQYSIENYEWIIDDLSVDIDVIPKKDWKKEFVNRALFKIEEYLKDHFPVLEFNKSKEKLEEFGFESQSKYAENLFFEYLKSGFIKENSLSKNIDEIVDLIEVSEQFIKNISNLFFENKNAFVRYYFNIQEFFKKNISSEISKYSVSDDFTVFFNSETQFSSVEELEKWLGNSKIYSEEKPYEIIENEEIDNENLNKNDKNPQDFKSDENKFNEVKDDGHHSLDNNFKEDKNNSQQNIHKILLERDLKINNSNLEISSVYIENAGLVILHPFLLNLFEKLNLCKDEVWIDKKSQHKAVLLTQYLITGQEVFFENELILNKLICGFPIENVINTKQKISKKEKEICNDLLRVVLEYWAVLKDSSVEALRETFLQRAGKLSPSETHSSELWVEEKGVDVLLAGLPWGIGIIKTPWMDNFLQCYWN